jgi:hypothetical protein
MTLSEMFGGTAGLSFVATVAGASLQVTEAVATAFVEFGLLACISIVIRLMLKHVFFSESYS